MEMFLDSVACNWYWLVSMTCISIGIEAELCVSQIRECELCRV